MIIKIFVISSGGILCYSKNYFENIIKEEELISGFLTGISDFTKEITGDEIRSIKLKNYRFIYSISSEVDYIFVIVVEINDQEEQARAQLELMQREFINRYKDILLKWNGDKSLFDGFDDFIEQRMYLPLEILITGEEGVGKKTIFSFLEGEEILELDDDFNETLMKEVKITDFHGVKQCVFRIKEFSELKSNPANYKTLLKASDVVLIVSNSAASNLGRIQEFITFLKSRIRTQRVYLLANFQDLEQTAFEPENIEESTGLKTFGFSAVQKDAKKEFQTILKNVFEDIILQKSSSSKNNDK